MTLVILSGGAFQDAMGEPISYGWVGASLVLSDTPGMLSNPPAGVNAILLGQDGNVLPGQTVVANDTTGLSGSFYNLNLYAASGTSMWNAQHTMTVLSTSTTQNLASLIVLMP